MDKIEYGREVFQKILELMEKHHQWFRESIPLIASENVPSPAVREALASDFGNRYAEGWPGERLYAGCRFIDQVELLAAELGRKVYDAEFVDVRPISGVAANISAYTVFTKPGDLMVALPVPHGGHISFGKLKWGGTAGVIRNLDVERYEFDEDNYMIDVDGTRRRLEKVEREEGRKPRLFMLGASVFLFPHPVREISDLAAEYDAKVVYDAAHVAGLIAGKIFQDPLREGVDAVTLSTHKTLAGPQHGMVLSWNKYAEDFKRVIFPGLHSNHHLHAVAGVAIALAEAYAFYEEYARQIVRNAKALARYLDERGIEVLYSNRGYTESHTLVADVSKFMDGMKAEKKLEEANIILNRNLIPKDYKLKTDYRSPSGIRMGTQEVTRLGMKEKDMEEIAEFIKLVLIDGREPREVAVKVREFRKMFQHVHYAFSSQTEAYEYIKIR
ncbi:MAG: serine hydroxymethyltransferase [Candidatus Caldarchaeales archaeon]